jgi:pimeloyl-ACP methyl ester carboxylesterase
MASILLIPGNMCDERLWLPVGHRLAAAGHRVEHAPTLNQASIEEMAEAVFAATTVPVVAIGFSMGAIVAAEMASRKPDQIIALALVAFNATGDLPERAAVRPRQQEAVRRGKLAEIVADELKPNYLAQANRGDSQLLNTVMAMALTLGPEVFVRQSEALRRRRDLRPELSGLGLPVMLACGSEDRLCPPEWHREWMQAIGANASFTQIDGAGHLLPLEQPQLLAAALIGWLAEEALCQIVS